MMVLLLMLQSLLSLATSILKYIFVLLCIIVGFHRCCSFMHRQLRRRRRQKQPPTPTSTTTGNIPTKHNKITKELVIAFFHPYCTGGGGGERVLWKMIQVLGQLISISQPTTTTTSHNNNHIVEEDDDTRKKQDIRNKNHIVLTFHPTIIIYTIDVPTVTYVEDVKKQIHDRFGLTISNQIQLQFVHLHPYAYLLRPIPFLSLLLESFGTMCLAYIGLYRSLFPKSSTTTTSTYLLPDLFIDTTGCALTYLPAKLLFGCHILAYVHYPTISTDMLQLVWERRRTGTYNHQSYIAKSFITTYIKLFYYIMFAILYGCVGSLSTMVFVNSTWTYNHIASLWKYAAYRKRIRIIYPPCSLPSSSNDESKSNSSNTTLDNDQRQPIILSIGQFRPEKDHTLQIEAMAMYLRKYHPTSIDNNNNNSGSSSTLNNNENEKLTFPKLVLIGSCRNDADQRRLETLQQLCRTLQISKHVQFVVNEPFVIVQQYLDQSTIGIHTMWNEHFGIGIVEMMAAGLIVIAHNSGGPKSDIVVPYHDVITNDCPGTTTATTTGFLATTVEEYAERIHYIMSLDAKEISVIRHNAIASSKRFTDDVFAQSFTIAMESLKL